MAKLKTYGKFRQRVLVQVLMNEPVVYYNRTRLAMIRESNSQLRLPKWEDAIRLQQRVVNILLLKIVSCGPTSWDPIREYLKSQFPPLYLLNM